MNRTEGQVRGTGQVQRTVDRYWDRGQGTGFIGQVAGTGDWGKDDG
jgi:hypothetical protein